MNKEDIIYDLKLGDVLVSNEYNFMIITEPNIVGIYKILNITTGVSSKASAYLSIDSALDKILEKFEISAVIKKETLDELIRRN